MKKILLAFGFAILVLGSCQAQKEKMKTIDKNGMKVSWHFENERVYFEVSAPTNGWVTIGFNQNSEIQGAYLLMSNVIQDRVNVVEHYTISAGNYKPITELGSVAKVENIKGKEVGDSTQIAFSLPVGALSKYQKDLKPNMDYFMILAYSRADDFQHHSMMRTHIKVTL
ncbi:MAG: DOMON domain-containing protein [Saprospiraceae bacterium]